MSEEDDNEGQSITNAAEVLFPGVIAKYLPGWLDQASSLVLIEHYPGVEDIRGSRRKKDTFDTVVFLSWSPRIAYNGRSQYVTFGEPDWKHLPEEALAELIGEVE